VVEDWAGVVVVAHGVAAVVVDWVVVDMVVVDWVVAVAVGPVVGAVKVVEDKVVEVVVAVRPEAVAEAAETVSTSHLCGASRSCGAPFFY
jgi:hypothetical protein